MLFIALVCATAAMGAIHVQGLETIYPNVSYAGVVVGGMTVAEAGDALVKAGYGARTDTRTVALPLGIPGHHADAARPSGARSLSDGAQGLRYDRDGEF